MGVRLGELSQGGLARVAAVRAGKRSVTELGSKSPSLPAPQRSAASWLPPPRLCLILSFLEMVGSVFGLASFTRHFAGEVPPRCCAHGNGSSISIAVGYFVVCVLLPQAGGGGSISLHVGLLHRAAQVSSRYSGWPLPEEVPRTPGQVALPFLTSCGSSGVLSPVLSCWSPRSARRQWRGHTPSGDDHPSLVH